MRTLSLLALLSLFLSGAARPESAAPRWNILFCFADDWGRYAGAYSRPGEAPSPSDVVRTPHVDRIAREGVLFRRAFVNAPSCTPCRSSLLSGRYFFRTGQGAILNGARWDPRIPSFPLQLRDAGYHIGKFTKVWSPGTPADAPFGGQQYAYEGAGRQFNNFSENVTAAVRAGIPLAQARARLLAEVRGNFDQFLAARPAGRPFLYWFGPTLVHRTWVKGSGKALWGLEPDSLRGKLPPFLPDVPEVREDFADYLGEIQALDAGIGVLLDRLAAVGELDRTLIVISGDHGAPGFPQGKCNLYDFGVGVPLVMRAPGSPGGRVVEDLVSLVDLCPTFLETGGVRPPADLDGRSLLSLLRSGDSGRTPAGRKWVLCGRERHVGAARAGNLPYPQRSLRADRYLYIRNFRPERWPLGDPGAVTESTAPGAALLEQNTRVAFADMDASPTKAWLVAHRRDPACQSFYQLAFGRRPAEELYNLLKDPHQLTNVAADSAYAATRRRLEQQLLAVLRTAGDPRVTGDGDTFERPPFTDP